MHILTRGHGFNGCRNLRVPFSLALTDRNTSGSGSSTSFSASLGETSVSRVTLIVVSTTGNTSQHNSVTVNGVAATSVVNTTGTNTRVSIWRINTSTMTENATIVATFAGSVDSRNVAVFRMVGAISETPFDTHAPGGGGDSSRTNTLDAPIGGAILTGAVGGSGSVTYTNSTEQYDVVVSLGNHSAGIYATAGATEANRVITVNACRAVASASWQ
jgi:hypothetical protein